MDKSNKGKLLPVEGKREEMQFSAVVLFAGNQSCKATSHIKKKFDFNGLLPPAQKQCK